MAERVFFFLGQFYLLNFRLEALLEILYRCQIGIFDFSTFGRITFKIKIMKLFLDLLKRELKFKW